MEKIRIIARLDVKGPNVIKGVNLEALRVVGKPEKMAEDYYRQGADELIYIDIVASLYGRQNLLNIVNLTSDKIFIPFTVGGGVRTLDDISLFLKAGADKVAINTAITKNPDLITKASRMFGSQCIVASIEAKKAPENKWEAYTENGREKTGLDVVKWAKKVEKLGAGEILLTSIDKEGTKKGFDIELIKQVSEAVSVPLIVCGGAGNAGHIVECIESGNIDAVAVSSILHYGTSTIGEIKNHLAKSGISVRKNAKL
ncbi:imidazole glycerol phosphate synthase subunit HisF [Candidatus Woesearchaeota archaeon]|nr:imidazole glycerol phosphate synthase subunit HisF [Candidatus Woesearchaeota archaeon]